MMFPILSIIMAPGDESDDHIDGYVTVFPPTTAPNDLTSTVTDFVTEVRNTRGAPGAQASGDTWKEYYTALLFLLMVVCLALLLFALVITANIIHKANRIAPANFGRHPQEQSGSASPAAPRLNPAFTSDQGDADAEYLMRALRRRRSPSSSVADLFTAQSTSEQQPAASHRVAEQLAAQLASEQQPATSQRVDEQFDARPASERLPSIFQRNSGVFATRPPPFTARPAASQRLIEMYNAQQASVQQPSTSQRVAELFAAKPASEQWPATSQGDAELFAARLASEQRPTTSWTQPDPLARIQLPGQVLEEDEYGMRPYCLDQEELILTPSRDLDQGEPPVQGEPLYLVQGEFPSQRRPLYLVEGKSVVQARARVQEEPQIQAQARDEAQAQVQARAQALDEAEAKTWAWIEAQALAQAQAGAQAQAEKLALIQTQARDAAEAQPQTRAPAEEQAQVQTRPQAQGQAQALAQAQAQEQGRVQTWVRGWAKAYGRRSRRVSPYVEEGVDSRDALDENLLTLHYRTAERGMVLRRAGRVQDKETEEDVTVPEDLEEDEVSV